jgi:hypothetical protein
MQLLQEGLRVAALTKRKTGKSSLTILAKPGLAWAGYQPLIPKGEQSGLLTRMVTESGSSYAPMKS